MTTNPTPTPATITVNGVAVALPTDPRVSLLDLLREHLHLAGTKKGCNQGACGACTVLVDGDERILGCLALAVQYAGRSVTSIEGVGTASTLHPLQSAFVEHDGFQCGYCTPGQICSAIGMAAEWRRGVPSQITGELGATTIRLTSDELRERMSGNLCRCGAYNGIVDAIAEVLTDRTGTGADSGVDLGHGSNDHVGARSAGAGDRTADRGLATEIHPATRIEVSQ